MENISNLKTVIQISQYINGQFMKGSKAHTIYDCRALDILALLEPLREKYKKKGKSPYVIRMQVSEYQKEGDNYRKQRGGCITLYDVFIKNIFKEVADIIENSVVNVNYDFNIYGGMWCLCKQSIGNSKVLEVDTSPNKLFAAKKKYNHITYVIGPDGKVVYKKEVGDEVS